MFRGHSWMLKSLKAMISFFRWYFFNIYILVGGLEHYFSIYWECHHPNWLSFFQRGRYTTNQYIYISHQNLDWLLMTGNPESWALPSGEQREPRSYGIFRLISPWNPRSSPWILNNQNWHSISTDYLLHHRWYHLRYPKSIPDYPPVIKCGTWKPTRNGGFNMKITYKSCIFHCHVWLPEGNQE